MKHLFNRNSIFVFGLSLFLFACSNSEKSEEINNEVSLTQEMQNIQTRNDQALKEADAISFDDTDFLKTKQPMSTRALDLIDDETGLVGDNAYNRKVYIYAIERLKKNAYIMDNQVYTSIKSGAEINIAEDLFDYLINVLVKDWNTALKEGRYEVIIKEKGGIDILPREKDENISRSSSSAADLMNMTDDQRFNTLKGLYDRGVTGYLSRYIKLNFGSSISGYPYKKQYYANNACSLLYDPNNPGGDCTHNSLTTSNNVEYSDRIVYKLFNSNHLTLVSVHVIK